MILCKSSLPKETSQHSAVMRVKKSTEALVWHGPALLSGLQAPNKALSSEALSYTTFLPLWGLPRLYLLTFREQWKVHLFLKSFANNDNGIYLQLCFKTQSQDSELTRWPANVDHFGDCVGKKKKEEKNSLPVNTSLALSQISFLELSEH